MPPDALVGDNWTKVTARHALPILVWCAETGTTITYSQLNKEIVNRGLGHHVMAIAYRYPAGAIGYALLELEQQRAPAELIPPLNSLVINEKTLLPGSGFNEFLEHYAQPEQAAERLTLDAKRAIVEEIHAAVFAYPHWQEILDQCELLPIADGVSLDPDAGEVPQPTRGGWSNEGESDEHKTLKEFIAQNPHRVGLPRGTPRGQLEYRFASGDSADVVFESAQGFFGVEVKSIVSCENDLSRGLYQAVKYQALLRAEQKAMRAPPTARAVLVCEHNLPPGLQNLADALGIRVIVVPVNH